MHMLVTGNLFFASGSSARPTTETSLLSKSKFAQWKALVTQVRSYMYFFPGIGV